MIISSWIKTVFLPFNVKVFPVFFLPSFPSLPPSLLLSFSFFLFSSFTALAKTFSKSWVQVASIYLYFFLNNKNDCVFYRHWVQPMEGKVNNQFPPWRAMAWRRSSLCWYDRQTEGWREKARPGPWMTEVTTAGALVLTEGSAGARPWWKLLTCINLSDSSIVSSFYR